MGSRVTDEVRFAAGAADRAMSGTPFPDTRRLLTRASEGADDKVTHARFRWIAVRFAGAAAAVLIALGALVLATAPVPGTDFAGEVPEYITSWVDSLYGNEQSVMNDLSLRWSTDWSSSGTYIESVFDGIAVEVSGRGAAKNGDNDG
jgi:hypothetical protein